MQVFCFGWGLLLVCVVTNVFLGRLSQGLGSELLGEQVALATQRQVTRLRQKFGIRTLNMLASVRRWQTMVLTAGCDVYTVPYPVLKAFFTQTERGAEQIQNCLFLPAKIPDNIYKIHSSERECRLSLRWKTVGSSEAKATAPKAEPSDKLCTGCSDHRRPSEIRAAGGSPKRAGNPLDRRVSDRTPATLPAVLY